METTLGVQLRQWRERRGLSVAEVAQDAKIAPSTLRRWEQGLVQPQIPALKAVLQALNLNASEQQAAILLLDAPRAIADSRDSIQKNLENLQSIPSAGDLWRAMRMRAGLTARQVAEALQVDSGRVCKWEQSQCVVPAERLEELFVLLKADKEERKELSERRLILSPPLDQALTDLEQCEELLWKYAHKIQQGERFSEDLHLFALEAHLWRQVHTDPHAFEILQRTWVWHADHLLWRGRFKEMHHYAMRVSEALDHHRPMKFYHVKAVCLCARFVVERRTAAGYREALRLLADIQNAPSRPHTVDIYRDMASYSAVLGRTEEALRLLLHSRKTAMQFEDIAGVKQADFVEGRTLVNAGNAGKALPLLLDIPWQNPNETLLLSDVLSQAYIQLHQWKEAQEHMAILEDVITRHHPHQLWRLHALETQR